jgi:hypothetical protein
VPAWRARLKLAGQHPGSAQQAHTDHLDDNPSLKPLIPDAIGKAYRDAIVEASVETKLSETIFAPACPWSYQQIIAPDFWPE